MSLFELSPVEARVLGCLLEKERLTPENYPLSLNSLATACNQTTNRDPILCLDERTLESALDSLRQKKLATVVFGAGSRVQKYRHNLLDVLTLERMEVAALCVLLLRGPQTPGELRSRTERLGGVSSLEQIEALLQTLAAGDEPLVRVLPPRPGQKERRWVELLSAEPADGWKEAQPAELKEERPSRTEELAAEIDKLRGELEALRTEFAEFRKQFE